MRVTWQLINELMGRKTNNIDTTLIKNFNNENITDIANKFAEKFSSNVKQILHKCDIEVLKYNKPRLPNSIYLTATNEEEIFIILKNMNERKGAGIDGIRPRDLKYYAALLTPVITTFVNSSLNSASIPTILKTSIIRPIYKSGIKNDCNNYRPIAILPVIEKILEEIIVRRLNEFLKKYKILNPSQYGFQKGKNINQLLGNFSNFINKCLSENIHCLALFVDFSKAFDTLSHTNLLGTLERYGIRGHCLKWFENYLELRSYRVKISNSLSNKTFSGNHGVPQGSKLGPILYLIYANDMINILKNSSAFAYADDTAIIVSNKKLDEASRIMQSELNIITKWSHDNGLVINASKTKLMHIKPRHLPNQEINLTFHNNQCLHNTNSSSVDSCNITIEQVKTYKYLGVYVDENFKWLTHIQNLRNKLRKSAFILFHLSNCAPFNVLKQAYLALAESYIRHGITAWGNSTYCSSLQQTQNQILKILLKNQQHNQQLHYAMIYGNTNSRYANQRTLVNNNTLININTHVINNTHTNNNTQINNNRNVNNNTHINNNTHVNNNTHTNNTNVNNPHVNNSTHLNNNADENSIAHVNNTQVTNNTRLNNNRNVNSTTVNNNTHINNNTHAYNHIHSNNNAYIYNTYVTNNTQLNNNTHVNTYPENNAHENSNTHLNSNSSANNNTIVNNNTNSSNIYINYTTNSRNIRYTPANNIATKLHVLNIRSLYNTTLINEFYNESRYLIPIDHIYNTRRRVEGRYKVERFRNNYGKNCLSVVLPTIFNKLPTNLLNLQNTCKRKHLLKYYFMSSQ